eukprot:GHVU01082988.1.p1 GENE.GHVU01082988.1~~GHVU01082988.1.p1  ORF type:complete len:324 (-),score=28.35 GHVU01082988.1:594-1565(-)
MWNATPESSSAWRLQSRRPPTPPRPSMCRLCHPPDWCQRCCLYSAACSSHPPVAVLSSFAPPPAPSYMLAYDPASLALLSAASAPSVSIRRRFAVSRADGVADVGSSHRGSRSRLRISAHQFEASNYRESQRPNVWRRSTRPSSTRICSATTHMEFGRPLPSSTKSPSIELPLRGGGGGECATGGGGGGGQLPAPTPPLLPQLVPLPAPLPPLLLLPVPLPEAPRWSPVPPTVALMLLLLKAFNVCTSWPRIRTSPSLERVAFRPNWMAAFSPTSMRGPEMCGQGDLMQLDCRSLTPPSVAEIDNGHAASITAPKSNRQTAVK